FVLRCAGPEPDAGNAGAVARPTDQAGDVGPLTDADVGQRGDPTADDPVEQVTAAAEQPEVTGEPDVPAGGAQPGDVPGKVQWHRARPHQLPGQAGEEPLHGPAAALQQGVA